MAEVAVRIAREPVVRLRQSPQVVVADIGALGVPRSDADLEVHDPGVGMPRLGQPVQPEPRLRHERGRGRRAELALSRPQQGIRVGRGVAELDEVTGIEPAAREVGGAARRDQVAIDGVGVGVGVGGPGVQRAVRSLRWLGLPTEVARR